MFISIVTLAVSLQIFRKLLRSITPNMKQKNFLKMHCTSPRRKKIDGKNDQILTKIRETLGKFVLKLGIKIVKHTINTNFFSYCHRP